MYWPISTTGLTVEPVIPTNMSVLCLIWLHLNCFRYILVTVWASILLIATSPHARCICALKVEAGGTVISPDLKKLKKHSVVASRSILKSCLSCCAPLGAVMGRQRLCLGGMLNALSRVMPVCSSFSLGIVPLFVTAQGTPHYLCMPYSS